MSDNTPRKRGPKTIVVGETMTRHVITVDSLTLRRLKVLGNDNVSKGVRIAATVTYEKHQKGDPLPEDIR